MTMGPRTEYVHAVRNTMTGLMCLRRRSINGLHLCSLPQPWLKTFYRFERDSATSMCLRCVAVLFGAGRTLRFP